MEYRADPRFFTRIETVANVVSAGAAREFSPTARVLVRKASPGVETRQVN